MWLSTYDSSKTSVEAVDSILPVTSFHLNLTKLQQQSSAYCIVCGCFQHSNRLHPKQAINLSINQLLDITLGLLL